jgi:cytochrome c-type biogenesis protein CcmH/NrfG
MFAVLLLGFGLVGLRSVLRPGAADGPTSTTAVVKPTTDVRQSAEPFASLARAIDAQPASADRYAALGAAYLAAGRPIEASLVLRVALTFDPQHAAARADYARARRSAP